MESDDNSLRCSECFYWGPQEDFVKLQPRKNRSGFRRPVCLKCHNTNCKRRYYQDVDKSRKRYWDYFTKNADRRLFKAVCTTAKKKGLERDVSLEDIVIPDQCAYLGYPITLEREKNIRTRYGPSVDRIDSSKGYVKGNIQVISYQANKMKNDATEQELIDFSTGVLRRLAPHLLKDPAT